MGRLRLSGYSRGTLHGWLLRVENICIKKIQENVFEANICYSLGVKIIVEFVL